MHAWWISSIATPRRSSSPTWKIRSGVGTATIASNVASSTVGQLRLRRIATETEAALLQRTQALLQALGEGAPDRHHLADRLHLRAENSLTYPGSFSNAHRGILVTT